MALKEMEADLETLERLKRQCDLDVSIDAKIILEELLDILIERVGEQVAIERGG